MRNRLHQLQLLGLLAVGGLLRLPTFARPILSDDEAIYAATADAMRTGAALYRDVVDHKPPAIYFVYRAVMAIFAPWCGPFSLFGPHLAVVVVVLATGLALYRVGCALGKESPSAHASGLGAAALYLVFSTTWHDYDALAANCELFLLLPQALAAALLALPAVESWPRRLGRYLAVGVAIGLSALCKYQGLTFLGVVGALLVVDAWTRRLTLGRAVLAGVIVVVGTAVPVAGFVLYAARAGSLAESFYWFRFNFAYVGAGLSGAQALGRGLFRTAIIGGAALPAYLSGALEVGASVRKVTRWVRTGAPREADRTALDVRGSVLVLAWVATSLVALSAGGRFFGHYFHLILAPLAVAGAPRVTVWWSSLPRRVATIAFALVSASTFFSLATFARRAAAAVDEDDPAYEPTAARIERLTPADGRIFVWGNSPQLYLLAHRSMGTRFSFCNYMTGESPGTDTETGKKDAEANRLAASWDMLFEDLERRRPVLFVDAAAAGWDGYAKFPMSRYPALLAYVKSRYELVTGNDTNDRDGADEIHARAHAPVGVEPKTAVLYRRKSH